MRTWQWVAVIAVSTIVLLVLGLRALLRGRRVPGKAKLVIAGAIVWLLSPLDPLPDVIPIAGVVDDLAVLIATVRYVLDQLQPPTPVDEPVDNALDRRTAIKPSNWRLSDNKRRPPELP
jgi:uncharacterized membrane protein YkvA (DUF1232 family)